MNRVAAKQEPQECFLRLSLSKKPGAARGFFDTPAMRNNLVSHRFFEKFRIKPFFKRLAGYGGRSPWGALTQSAKHARCVFQQTEPRGTMPAGSPRPPAVYKISGFSPIARKASVKIFTAVVSIRTWMCSLG